MTDMIVKSSNGGQLGSPVRMLPHSSSSSDNDAHSQNPSESSSIGGVKHSDREKAYLAMSRPFPHRLSPEQRRAASESSNGSASSPRSLLQRRKESKGLVTKESIFSLPIFHGSAAGGSVKRAAQPQYDQQPVRRPGPPTPKDVEKGGGMRIHEGPRPASLNVQTRPRQTHTNAERVILCPYPSCSFGYRRSKMHEMYLHLSQVHGSRKCLWCEDTMQGHFASTEDGHGEGDITRHLREQHRHQLLESFGLVDCKACVFDGRDYLMVPLDAPARVLPQPAAKEDGNVEIGNATRDREPVTPEKQVNQLRSPPLTEVKQKRGRRNSHETSHKRQRTEEPDVATEAKAGDFVPGEDMYCSRCLRKAPRIVDRTPGRSDLGRDVELAFHTDPKRSCRIRNTLGDTANLPNRSGWIRTQDLTDPINQIKAEFLEKHPEYEATLYPQKVRSTLWKYDPNNQLNREAWGLPWPPSAAGADKKRKRDAIGQDGNAGEQGDECLPGKEPQRQDSAATSRPNSSASRFIKPRYLKPPRASVDPTYRPDPDSETSSDSEAIADQAQFVVKSLPSREQQQQQQQQQAKRRRVVIDGIYRPNRNSSPSSDSDDEPEVTRKPRRKITRTETKAPPSDAAYRPDSTDIQAIRVEDGNKSEDSNSSSPASLSGAVHVKAGLDPVHDPVLLGEARTMKKSAQAGKRDVELGVSRAPFGA